MKKICLSLCLVCIFAIAALGQTSLTQTTLAAAQGIGPASLPSGTQSPLMTFVSLASATGVQLAALGTQPVTYIYVDQELEGIVSLLPGQTTIFNVLRAQGGTKAAPHVSGAMVLLATITPQFGGGAGSGGFQQIDAPLGGACTGSNTIFTPWINVLTGAQWLCSSITGTWVPGWINPLYPGAAKVTAAVASAAGLVTPSGPLFHITGALAITGFNIPVGFNATGSGGGQFCAIPDGTFTTTTANNIALASTAVVNKLLCWTWDATNSKFVPTY